MKSYKCHSVTNTHTKKQPKQQLRKSIKFNMIIKRYQSLLHRELQDKQTITIVVLSKGQDVSFVLVRESIEADVITTHVDLFVFPLVASLSDLFQSKQATGNTRNIDH